MKIKDFYEKFNKDNSAVDKIMNDDMYTPYAMKIMKCNVIAQQTANNTPMRKLLFTKMLIESYTKLEFDNSTGEAFMEDFDILMKNELVDVILGKIPSAEVDTYHTMLMDTVEDYKNSGASLMQGLQEILQLAENVGEDA